MTSNRDSDAGLCKHQLLFFCLKEEEEKDVVYGETCRSDLSACAGS